MVKLEFDNCTLEYQIGDCLELMKGLPDDNIDMTITSPPYDNLRDYGGYVFEFEGIAKELFRITNEGGVVVWVVGDATIKGSETGTSFKQVLYFKEIGFNLHDTMIYIKKGISNPSNNRYHQAFEYMFILSKGSPKTFNPIKDRKNIEKKLGGDCKRQKDGSTKKGKSGGKKLSFFGNRFNYWIIGRDIENQSHPATFPEALVNDHIISWSNEGDTVLDPFLGSGTTLLACRKTGRNGIGFEINPDYEPIIRKRIMADTKTIWQFGD